MVDAERGVLLQAVARRGMKELERTEVLAVRYDVPLPDEFFDATPPAGTVVAPFADLDSVRPEAMTAEEAAIRAPFQVWSVSPAPEGWTTEVAYWPGSDLWGGGARVMLLYRSPDHRRLLHLEEEPAHDALSIHEWSEGPGRRTRLPRPRARGNLRLRLRRGGTLITIRGEGVSVRDLVRAAEALEPVGAGATRRTP